VLLKIQENDLRGGGTGGSRFSGGLRSPSLMMKRIDRQQPRQPGRDETAGAREGPSSQCQGAAPSERARTLYPGFRRAPAIIAWRRAGLPLTPFAHCREETSQLPAVALDDPRELGALGQCHADAIDGDVIPAAEPRWRPANTGRERSGICRSKRNPGAASGGNSALSRPGSSRSGSPRVPGRRDCG
jgi:hypothetical protein